MAKNIGKIGILTFIALVIATGLGLTMNYMNTNKFQNFVPMDLVKTTVFMFVIVMLLFNTLFSHMFMKGKAQELLFFFSNTLLIANLAGYIVFCMFECGFDFEKLDWYGLLLRAALPDIKFLGFTIVIWMLVMIVYCTIIDKKMLDFIFGTGNSIRGNGKLNQTEANLENSRWLTKAEIDKMFKPTTYTNLQNLKKDGIPVGAELIKNGKDMKVAFNSPCHSIIIGSTGSGKTTTFVSPMIQLLGATGAGSSMVITDPKGELFSLHSKFLNSRGYDVKVIDLRDTYSSYRWNPLDEIWDNYQSYLNASKNVFLRTDKAIDSGLKLVGDEIAFEGLKEYYEFDGKAYVSREKVVEAIKIFKKKTFDEVYEDLNDLCSVLIPVENDKDPMWEKGARSIVFAVLLAMLEDSEKPELGMVKEKYNFFNMTKILQNSQNDYKELRNYFRGRPVLSKALSLSKQVCDAATQTRASYMSIVYEKLTMFNDAGICALTSASDFSSRGLADRPTALFLKIPDEKDTRHNLAAIFILNIYKTLIKVASAKEDLTLDRNVYFIMDEFGNMPKIEKFDKFITVGRSRKIWFNMIVQSYAQLNNVYGETVAEIVKGNCGIKMFIGSNDANTCKEYSELCGNITVVTRSTSYSGSGGNSNESVSQQIQVRPLIYPSELQRINHPGDIGHSIIVTFGNYPLKTYFTPSFNVPFYKMGKMETNDVERYFDEKKIAYYASKRNEIISGEAEKDKEIVKEEPKEEKTQVVESGALGAAQNDMVQTETKPKAPRKKTIKVAKELKDIQLQYEEYRKSSPNTSMMEFIKTIVNGGNNNEEESTGKEE